MGHECAGQTHAGERMGQVIPRTNPYRILTCATLLALAFVGCHSDNPCPVRVTNQSSHYPLVEIAQDSLFDMYEQAFLLVPQDSAFVGYFPKGTVLWLRGSADHGGLTVRDTSIFEGVPVAVTILGKTTFLFVDDSLGDVVMRVIQ